MKNIEKIKHLVAASFCGRDVVLNAISQQLNLFVVLLCVQVFCKSELGCIIHKKSRWPLRALTYAGCGCIPSELNVVLQKLILLLANVSLSGFNLKPDLNENFQMKVLLGRSMTNTMILTTNFFFRVIVQTQQKHQWMT